MTLPFRFPLYELGVAGPEETKNLTRKILRLIQIRWATPSVEKISDIGKVNCREDPYTTAFCLGGRTVAWPCAFKEMLQLWNRRETYLCESARNSRSISEAAGVR